MLKSTQRMQTRNSEGTQARISAQRTGNMSTMSHSNNKELYKELIKDMYCPKYLYLSPFTFDEVRQMSVQLPHNRVAMSIKMQEIGCLQHQI